MNKKNRFSNSTLYRNYAVVKGESDGLYYAIIVTFGKKSISSYSIAVSAANYAVFPRNWASFDVALREKFSSRGQGYLELRDAKPRD